MNSEKVLALCLLAFTVSYVSAANIYDARLDITDPNERLAEAIRSVRQLNSAPIQDTVRNNLLDALYRMANASAVTGTNVSRAAATVIRGFVQDSFNIGSIGIYIPRLIFLDGPNQFIETMRLVRQGSIRLPTDTDTAIDTLINFAGSVRDSNIPNNLTVPLVSFFPNIFRGAETLTGEILFNTFAFLAPVGPDINPDSLNTYINRWDSSTTTGRPAPAATTGSV
ncbi:hypothetical protein Ocin01_19349 [Orchesella cincta]|uniref:Uncharacterized protein n=1 Tax=Orchesella cincta TaxID=48709 RepID=A0A1D2M2Y6_ORCCI|nr:hypothetical protein Ocin01_19349 [Orchesella cincta]